MLTSSTFSPRYIMSARSAILPLFFSIVALSDAGAQTPADPAALVKSCSELVDQKKVNEAVTLGRQAETMLTDHLARQPRDADGYVALARALSQCILPGADLMGQGELSTRAIELLETALSIDPKHWTARFVLASINL